MQGEIEWRGGADGPILLHDFLTDDVTEVKPDLVAPPAKTAGHGGADFFLVNSFLKAETADYFSSESQMVSLIP